MPFGCHLLLYLLMALLDLINLAFSFLFNCRAKLSIELLINVKALLKVDASLDPPKFTSEPLSFFPKRGVLGALNHFFLLALSLFWGGSLLKESL